MMQWNPHMKQFLQILLILLLAISQLDCASNQPLVNTSDQSKLDDEIDKIEKMDFNSLKEKYPTLDRQKRFVELYIHSNCQLFGELIFKENHKKFYKECIKNIAQDALQKSKKEAELRASLLQQNKKGSSLGCCTVM